MNNPKDPSRYELGELILLLIDGVISDEEFALLQSRLASDPKAVDSYYAFLSVYLGIHSQPALAIPLPASAHSVSEYNSLLAHLAESEKTAQPLAIEKPESVQPQADVAPVPAVPAKISRMPLYTLAAAMAAMLLLIAFIRLMPLPPVEVATLTDSLNVQWAESGLSTKAGTRLLSRCGPMTLDRGFAEITFDNNARVVIESPAKFELITTDQLHLLYGRVYARVPREAMGFTVALNHSKVIDLGTEFGVSAATNGTTELHVVKGKTMLIAGEKTDRNNITVLEGIAKRIAGQTFKVVDIACNDSVFVHRIDSAKKLIWRGRHDPEIIDSLCDYHEEDGRARTVPSVLSGQPAFLTQLGLEVASLARKDSSVNAGDGILFTGDGVVFGALAGGDAGRNLIRTCDTMFDSISFDAAVTIVNSDRNRQVWLGMGGGNLGGYGVPDCTFLEPYGQSFAAADSVWILAQGKELSTHRQIGAAASVANKPSGPLHLLDSVSGLVRIQMHYDAVSKIVLFSLDNDYRGMFVPDVTLGPLDVSGLYQAHPARVYFGGDDGAVLRDFSIRICQ